MERSEQENVVEIALKTKTKDASWVIDSGCTSHMTGDKMLLKNTQDVEKGFVKFADKSGLKIRGLGEATFGSEKLFCKEVLFVDGLKYNLMSVSQLCDSGHEVLFTHQGYIVKSSKNGEIIAKGTRNKKDLYLIDEKENTCLLSTADENTLWHKRLGHINQKSMRELVKNKAVSNLPELKRDKDSVCSTCQRGKLANTSHKLKEHNSKGVLDIIHSDICDPMRHKATNGERYFILFVDDFTRMMCIMHIKHKNEALGCFKRYLRLAQNQLGKKIKVLRTDNGMEFTSHEFEVYLEKHGIQHQVSSVRTPQQNGVVERKKQNSGRNGSFNDD